MQTVTSWSILFHTIWFVRLNNTGLVPCDNVKTLYTVHDVRSCSHITLLCVL